jgi:Flp pilus assembly protein TadG
VTGDRRGSVLVLSLLLTVLVLALVAILVVELGHHFVALAEAQRTADAAAHAGAVTLVMDPDDGDGAESAARGTAAHNPVRGRGATVEVEVRPDTSVWVRATAPVPSIFGWKTGVGARAAAKVFNGDDGPWVRIVE